MPQHPEHLGNSASVVTRDFGPALGFLHKLSVALTAVVKGQAFPLSPSFICKTAQDYFGEHPCSSSQHATRDMTWTFRGRSPTSPRKIRCILHVIVASHICCKTNICQKCPLLWHKDNVPRSIRLSTHSQVSFRKSQKRDADTLTTAYMQKSPFSGCVLNTDHLQQLVLFRKRRHRENISALYILRWLKCKA